MPNVNLKTLAKSSDSKDTDSGAETYPAAVLLCVQNLDQAG